mgnify:FL=1
MGLTIAANPISLQIGSSEAMRIDSSGNVGIGATNVQKKLHVRDDGDSYPMLVQNRTNDTSTCGIALIAAGVDFADNRYASIEAVSGGTGNTLHHLAFRTCTNSGTPQEQMRIKDSGNVGIGTTDPQRRLHVATQHDDGGIIAQFENSNSGNFGGLRILSGVVDRECRFQSLYGNSFFTFYTEGTGSAEERMRIDSSGNVDITTGNVKIKTAKKGIFSDGTFSLGNDATTTFNIGYAAFFVITVTNCSEVTNGTSGAFFANTASSLINEISDPFGDFTANNNVANTTGVTKTTNSNLITIRNDYGATATYAVAIFGTTN